MQKDGGARVDEFSGAAIGMHFLVGQLFNHPQGLPRTGALAPKLSQSPKMYCNRNSLGMIGLPLWVLTLREASH